ncbi:MAG: hypothetical protein ACRD20_04335 [Terriglobales bacterium]
MVTTPRSSCMPSSPARISLQFLVTILCFALHVPASQAAPAAQKPDQPYALIFGTVWGPDSRPLYGVKVKIRRADQKKAHWELYSDHHGEFAQRVPPGPADYLIQTDLKGYKSPAGKELHQDGEVKVHIDNDERQDLGLHLKQ